MASKQKRLSFLVPAEAAESLKDFSQGHSMSQTEALKKAIRVLTVIFEEQDRGNTIQSTNGSLTREMYFV